ncbi:MAG TPA: serine hydrolase [Rhizomicrobium sp.]|nr:serine hydrolase [Rhizomicrobium sp.]
MKRFSTIVLLAALLPAAAFAQTIPSDGEILKMLATRVDQQHWATGIVVGIVTPQGTRTVAHGVTSKDGAQKVGADTVYDIGSITKVFTALTLADMAQHGEVALDDPVAKYLPKGAVLPKDGARQITLADLATHTAGLPLRPDNLAPKDPDNKYAEYSEADLYRFLAHAKPAHPIGGTYDYSNPSFGLLGVALAHRAGADLDTLIEIRILQPLGMDDTRRDATPAMRSRMAQGYSYDVASASLTPSEHWDFGSGVAGAGGYRSTAGDMIKFLQAILGARPLALSADFATMTKTRRPGGMMPATAIALAWNILDQDGHEIAWKNGSVGGFRSFIGYDASAHTGVVVLTNAQTSVGGDDIGLHILDPKIPVDLHIPRKHVETKLDPALLDRYVGAYKYADNDFMVVTRQGDHLAESENGQDKLELFAEGERDFFFKVADAQITFETGPDGKVTAAIWRQGGQDQRGVRMP